MAAPMPLAPPLMSTTRSRRSRSIVPPRVQFYAGRISENKPAGQKSDADSGPARGVGPVGAGRGVAFRLVDGMRLVGQVLWVRFGEGKMALEEPSAGYRRKHIGRAHAWT